MYDSKPAVFLKFVVVGGGIAGLATAYGLKRSGHEVVILEKDDGPHTGSGTLYSPPNMTRLLYRWGLKSQFEGRARQFERIAFRNGNTGEWIGSLKLQEDFMKNLVEGFYFIMHKDLHDMLRDLALAEGVEIRYGATVIDVDSDRGSVKMATGEVFDADIIIGADGFDSVVRPLITTSDDASLNPILENYLMLTTTIPNEIVDMDNEVRDLVKVLDEEWCAWFGDGYLASAKVQRGGDAITVMLNQAYSGPIRPDNERWSESRSLESFGLSMESFEPRLRKLMMLAPKLTSCIYAPRSCPADMVSGNSRVVLVGSAAHPIIPGSNHVTALAIEDAHTIGCLFSRVESKTQIPRLLTAYEEIRYARVLDVHEYDLLTLSRLRCPPGASQDARDDFMRATLVWGDWDHMDEAGFRAMWGKEIEIYAHDAAEKVDGWWGQWGRLVSSRKEGGHSATDVEVSVVTSAPPRYQVA